MGWLINRRGWENLRWMVRSRQLMRLSFLGGLSEGRRIKGEEVLPSRKNTGLMTSAQRSCTLEEWFTT